MEDYILDSPGKFNVDGYVEAQPTTYNLAAAETLPKAYQQTTLYECHEEELINRKSALLYNDADYVERNRYEQNLKTLTVALQFARARSKTTIVWIKELKMTDRTVFEELGTMLNIDPGFFESNTVVRGQQSLQDKPLPSQHRFFQLEASQDTVAAVFFKRADKLPHDELENTTSK
jgi:hypothetical protein